MCEVFLSVFVLYLLLLSKQKCESRARSSAYSVTRAAARASLKLRKRNACGQIGNPADVAMLAADPRVAEAVRPLLTFPPILDSEQDSTLPRFGFPVCARGGGTPARTVLV